MNKRWFIDTAKVETYQGAGAYEDNFAPPVTHSGFFDGAIRLVLDKEGDQVVSVSTWFTAIENAPVYTLDSRVTGSDGRVGRVIKVNSLRTPTGIEDHVEVHLL
jgi:hypothetical protein